MLKSRLIDYSERRKTSGILTGWRLILILVLLSLGMMVYPQEFADAEPAGVTAERYYCVWENEWSTTSLTSVEIQPSVGYYPLRLSFTPQATANYLLFVCFSTSNSKDNVATTVELYQNDVQVYTRTWTPNVAGDWVTAGYARIISIPGGISQTFRLTLKTGSTGTSALIRDASIMLFKVQNYYYAEDNNTYVFQSGTYQDGATLQIPNTASGDYLVIGSNSLMSSNPAKILYCNWLRGNISQTEVVRNFSKAYELRGYLFMRVMTFNNTAETVKFQYKTQVPNECHVTSQRLMAIRLSDLGIDTQSVESETESSVQGTSYVTRLSKTVTPSQAGDYLVMGFAMVNGNSTKAGDEAYARLNIDNTYFAERNFRPESTLDYIPLFAFKKSRFTIGNHTVKIEYRSSSPTVTTKIKNARILAFKVNTLQSYEDAGVTPRTVFDGNHKIIYLYGYGYQYQWDVTPPAPMPYKLAYYDGGTAHNGVGGVLVNTTNLNSNYNRSISTSFNFSTVPGASYGIWHAVVYRAYSGDSSPPTSYLANDPNSIMEIQFTVTQEALVCTPPTVTSVVLYDSTRGAMMTGMSPQVEYAVKVSVTCGSGLSTLNTVRAVLFYDADGNYTSGEVPTSGNTQTAAIFTCTVGTTPVWSIDPGTNTTWSLVTTNCVQPSLAGSSGDFWFHFRPGKVATATSGVSRWHLYVRVVNAGGFGEGYQTGLIMNWYGEITVHTGLVNFGTVAPGSDFVTNKVTQIGLTYISNGSFRKRVKVSSPWTGSGYAIYLNTSGNPVEGEFSLKGDDTPDISNAFLLSTEYVTVGNGVQTGENGSLEDTNTLWVKVGTGIMPYQYSGVIYYSIAP